MARPTAGVPIDAARAARDAVRRRLADAPGVVAIGLTRGPGGDYAVKVDVERERPAGLPDVVDGVAVVVAVTGRVARLAAPPKARPASGG